MHESRNLRNIETQPSVSIVVPVYRATERLRELVSRLHGSLDDSEHEIILVDDGSPLATWAVIKGLSNIDSRVVGVRLGKNAGQHSALLAGVREARFPIIVTLDDDLQNPPEEIPKLLEALQNGVDVVYGVPVTVAQRRWRSTGSASVRWFLSSLLDAPSAKEMGSFRAFRTSLRDGFGGNLGPGVSLDALLSWSTSRFSSTVVEHHPRKEGKSNYSFRSLIRFGVDTATGYSSKPLRFISYLGLASALAGFGVAFFILFRAILFGSSVPGFPFLASLVAMTSGVQMLALGVIGEYIARMHFRVMRKPSYVVAELLRGSISSDGE